MKTTAAATVVLLVGLAWLAWLAWPAEPDAGTPAPRVEAAAGDGSRSAGHAPALAPREAARTPSLEREAAPAPPPPATPPDQHVATTVHGRVVDANGRGVPGASVQVASRRATCGDDGAFTIDVLTPDAALHAWAVGREPATVPAIGRQPEALAGAPVTVRLRGAALAIEGVVWTSDGAPARGWNLHLHSGGTIVDGAAMPPLTIEDLAHGATIPSGAFGHGPVSDSRGRAGVPRSNPNELRLPADGAFRIGGLREGHDYVLRAWHPRSLEAVLSAPIRAGTRGFFFVLPPPDCRGRVVGRVVDRHGGPVQDVRVRLTIRLWSSGGSEAYGTGQAATTNDEGAFLFTAVARQPLLLRFDGDGIESTSRELPAEAGDADVLVVAETICRFRFEPDPALPPPTSMRVQDSEGRALRVERLLEPGHSQRGTRHGWKPGDEELELRVVDRAFELVLAGDHGELRRVPLRLRHGEVAVVRG